MSFGYSVGDAILLTQLAWRTIQNARKACGEHDELTLELQGLHGVIRRLEHDVRRPTCPINRDPDTYEDELEGLVNGCKINLNVLDQVLTKYNALSERERSVRQLWQKIRFGNGEMLDMASLKARLTYYTSALSLFLNIVSTGTMGRVERQLVDAGGDLKEIKIAINEITARFMSKSKGQEGSILTAYADDDTAVWKEFRRELVQNGFTSSVIRKHKKPIMSYIEELGSRGLLDDVDPHNEAEKQDLNSKPVIEGTLSPHRDTRGDSEASLGSQIEVESTIMSKALPHSDFKPRAAKPEDQKSPTDNSFLKTMSSAEPTFEISYKELFEMLEPRVKEAIELRVQKLPINEFLSKFGPFFPSIRSKEEWVDVATFKLVPRLLSKIPKNGSVLRVPRVEVPSTDGIVTFQPHPRLYAAVDAYVDRMVDDKFLEKITHYLERILREREGFSLIHG